MPPFCLLNCEALCALNEKAVYVTDYRESYLEVIWKGKVEVTCVFFGKAGLSGTESDWLDACNTEFNWMVLGSSTQQTLFRCSPPVSPRLLLMRHRWPLSGHCPRHGAVRCWRRARSRAWNADRQHRCKTQTQDTHTNTQMRRVMGKTSLGFLVTSGQCWRTFCSHCLRLYITLPLSTFSF